MFIRTVQISSLATVCVGQPLLVFWSHTEQSWMFALIVAALLKITYIVLHLLPIAYQRCTDSEIFDSDSAPASAEYTPTPKHFKVLDSDSCLNSKVIYLKAVAIDTPVDLEI